MDGSPSLHTSYTRRFFAIGIAMALIFSFGLHDIHLEHEHGQAAGAHTHAAQGLDHKGEGSSGSSVVTISEYLHAMDRKLFIVVLSFFWLLVGVVGLFGAKKHELFGAQHSTLFRFQILSVYFAVVYSYLVELFRRGVIHNRHYG